jgi:hypothetical protein
MDPYLIAQIHADNHARMQQAHMYCDAVNQESAHQAHMQQAQYAAQARFHQQPSGYCETSEYPCVSPLSGMPYPDPDHEVDMSQVPESDDDRRTRRSSRTQRAAEDPTESMRDKLARMHMLSGGLGDRDEAPRRSSCRDGESTYRASESRRDRDRRDEPSLFSCRGGESSHRQSESRREDGSYRQSESRREGGSSYRPSPPRREGGSSYRPSSSRRDGGSYYRPSSSRREGGSSYRPSSSRRDRGTDHDLSEYRAETVARPPTLSSARFNGRDRDFLDYGDDGLTREDLRDYREAAREGAREGCSAEMNPYGEFGGRRRSRYY